MPKFYMIFAQKINKIPEFYTLFVWKMPKFYMIITRKIFSPKFFGGTYPLLPAPPSIFYTYAIFWKRYIFKS